LLVYRVGKIARSALKRTKVLLENVRGRVLGLVLTGLKAEVSPDYEELEYYRYAYGNEPSRVERERIPRQKKSLSRRIADLFSRRVS
jgi:Mrp family chromosome partitioning ATPase